MSRIGKKPIPLPSGVSVEIGKNNLVVKGKLGELSQEYAEVSVALKDGELLVERPSDSKQHKALHGLYRSLFYNMVKGVSEGFVKKMELVGVGYRASNQGQRLELSLGFSHGILMELPKEIKLETTAEKGQNPTIKLTSHDKQLLGQVASKIRSFRKTEPYKGKGIKFAGEVLRRKAGKSA